MCINEYKYITFKKYAYVLNDLLRLILLNTSQLLVDLSGSSGGNFLFSVATGKYFKLGLIVNHSCSFVDCCI